MSLIRLSPIGFRWVHERALVQFDLDAPNPNLESVAARPTWQGRKSVGYELECDTTDHEPHTY